jgi:hypothetical protein
MANVELKLDWSKSDTQKVCAAARRQKKKDSELLSGLIFLSLALVRTVFRAKSEQMTFQCAKMTRKIIKKRLLSQRLIVIDGDSIIKMRRDVPRVRIYQTTSISG